MATLGFHRTPGPALPSLNVTPRPARLAEVWYSNEPAGYVPILTSGFGNKSADRWMLGTPEGTVQAVVPTLGAPGVPVGSVRVVYPAGWKPVAAATSPKYRQILGGGIRNVYLSFWFRVSPSWKAGPQGVDNILTLRTKPGTPELRLAFMREQGAELVPSLRLGGLHRPYDGVAAPELAPNSAPGTTVRRGRWQHWELLLRGNHPGHADGKLTWWLNGLPTGDQAGLEFWGPGGPWIRDVAWDLTAPVAGTPILQRIVLDEMYLSAPATSGDRIVVMNDFESGVQSQAPAGTTILVDAFTGTGASPCANDLVVAGGAILPNFLDAGANCPPDEIAVFSTDNAATIDGGAGGGQGAAQSPAQGIWHDMSGERRVEDSRGPRPVEAVLWIVKEEDSRKRKVELVARGEVEQANAMFNENRAGIRLEVVDVEHVWDSSPTSVAARAAIGCQSVNGSTACTCLPTLPASGFFRAGKLNAYYVPQVFDEPASPRIVGGLNCRYDHSNTLLDPNIVYMSVAMSSPTALAHEVGHGLGLEHTADGSGEWYQGKVPADNVMRDDKWLVSASLLLGQAFRVNVETRSLLRRNGMQSGPHRSCECELWAACTRANFILESELGQQCPPVTRAWP